MSTKFMVFFLACFGGAHLQDYHLLNLLESNVNCFHKINFNVYYTINTLLSSLKIDKSFIKTDHVQMLIKILHFQIIELATYNCKVFEELVNVSTTNNSQTHKHEVVEMIQSIVTEETDNIHSNNTNKKMNVLNGIFKDNSETYGSYESKYYLKDILATESILKENMNEPIIHNTENDRKVKNGIIGNKLWELKTWIPKSNEEYEEINGMGGRRIYRAKKSRIKDYPFLASLHIMADFMCAGSIISKDLVITAASCLQMAYESKIYRDNPRTTFVRVGSDYTKRSGELIPIVEIIFHPDYDSKTLKNNLAIVKMMGKLKDSKHRKIKRVKFNKNGRGLSNDVKEITILGWGATDNKHKPNNLQKLGIANLNIYNTEDCQDIYSKFYVTDTNFCAGFKNKGGGACMGDVGGPAILDEELIGVISFGSSVCGRTDAPTVFTNIGYYADWIQHVINKKPIMRHGYIEMNKALDLLILPMYTVKPTPKPVTRSTIPINISEYADLYILKNIIHELLSPNASLVDYLINESFDTSEDFTEPSSYDKSQNAITQALRNFQAPMQTKAIPNDEILHSKAPNPTKRPGINNFSSNKPMHNYKYTRTKSTPKTKPSESDLKSNHHKSSSNEKDVKEINMEQMFSSYTHLDVNNRESIKKIILKNEATNINYNAPIRPTAHIKLTTAITVKESYEITKIPIQHDYKSSSHQSEDISSYYYELPNNSNEMIRHNPNYTEIIIVDEEDVKESNNVLIKEKQTDPTGYEINDIFEYVSFVSGNNDRINKKQKKFTKKRIEDYDESDKRIIVNKNIVQSSKARKIPPDESVERSTIKNRVMTTGITQSIDTAKIVGDEEKETLPHGFADLISDGDFDYIEKLYPGNAGYNEFNEEHNDNRYTKKANYPNYL